MFSKKLFGIIGKISHGHARGRKGPRSKGLLKNPFFYFGAASFMLFGLIYSACGSSSLNAASNSKAVLNSFLTGQNISDNLFFSQSDSAPLETPDLKIMQDNTLCAVATPCVVSAKVLGDTFGSSVQPGKDIADYIVQPGDTLQTIAANNNITANTLAWANELASSSIVKAGQTLAIPPVDGVLYVVKSGDTIGALSQTYKAKTDEIIAFNNLSSQDDIYIGDVLMLPGGIMPKKASPIQNNNRVPLADNFFIFPTEGRVTQGLHFYNAVDTANKCGTPVYAAAAGTVQRVKYGYNLGMGNHITILHNNGVVTYYGHVMAIFVKPGDKVNVGDRVALMGGGTGTPGDGLSTGCHLHFQVIGAKNPLAKYLLGAKIGYK